MIFLYFSTIHFVKSGFSYIYRNWDGESTKHNCINYILSVKNKFLVYIKLLMYFCVYENTWHVMFHIHSTVCICYINIQPYSHILWHYKIIEPHMLFYYVYDMIMHKLNKYKRKTFPSTFLLLSFYHETQTRFLKHSWFNFCDVKSFVFEERREKKTKLLYFLLFLFLWILCIREV